MESSHKRIIADLETKHHAEIENLLAEKENALAEETQVMEMQLWSFKLVNLHRKIASNRKLVLTINFFQATLQALESMRKAHQNDVQREVNRFKQEFLRKFNIENKEQLDSIASYKEERELDEVRHEILSLSEKYSQKCVETISLEEKLRNTQQKLRHAKQVIQNYEMKSKNLRPNSYEEAEGEADSLHCKSDDVSWLLGDFRIVSIGRVV